MIKVHHLNKHFNKGQKNSIHVLNNVSLDFPEKGLVVLLGPSGSGKTTLLNVIGGLDKVDKGFIEFYQHQIKSYHPSVWDKIRTQEIGYIFQNYYLMGNLSVFDNVAFVLKMIGIHDEEAIEENVHYILNQVGMYRFRKKKASQLSGGQMQRVAIARALVKNPKVIIADEPTGNLDSKNTLEIMNIIKSISTQKLVILVTHEKEIAHFYGDRIIEIKDGMITNDMQNTDQSDHNFQSENIFYLKDLKAVDHFSSDHLKVSYYTDTDSIDETHVRLIIKNKTLYLDVSSELQKIRLIDDESHIQIKDEHFKKSTRDELLKTSFDLQRLDHSALSKHKKLAISFKTSFWIALRRIFQFGRKGKLMLLIFAIAGALVASTFINVYSIISLDYKRYLNRDENVLAVNLGTNGPMQLELVYDDLIAAIDGQTYFMSYDHFYNANNYALYLDELNFKNLPTTQVEFIDYLQSNELMYGRMPENEFEIVISKAVYSTGNVYDVSYTDVGIWGLDGLIGEEVVLRGLYESAPYKFKIVGIVDRHYPVMFAYNHWSFAYLMNFYFEPTEFDRIEFEKQLVLNALGSARSVFIYTDNQTLLTENLTDLSYEVHNASELARERNQMDIATALAGNIGGSGIFILGALLAFYFVMRSSMISRIYEISVYRALGVKRSEIMSSFAVEILMITVISSVLGFLLMSFIFYQIGTTPLSVLANFKVDLIVILTGLLFVLLTNLIVGILPVAFLLRKTPAQILSSYDM